MWILYFLYGNGRIDQNVKAHENKDICEGYVAGGGGGGGGRKGGFFLGWGPPRVFFF